MHSFFIAITNIIITKRIHLEVINCIFAINMIKYRHKKSYKNIFYLNEVSFVATLKELFDIFCTNTDIHISVTDTSGITYNELFSLPYKYRVHSREYCDIAKTSPQGFDQCMRCKKICNEMARHYKKPFDGLCSFGLYELVYPIIENNTMLCILYIGNIVNNISDSAAKLTKTSRYVKCDYNKMRSALSSLQRTEDTRRYFAMAEFIEEFFKNHTADTNKFENNYHWAVRAAKDYVRANYSRPLTLKIISNLYFINEKYLGRLFKKQMGMSFHQYLTEIRLKEAASQLRHTNSNVLEVSINCGFSSPSYFNNIFSSRYGMTPKSYKQKFSGKSSKNSVENIFDYL